MTNNDGMNSGGTHLMWWATLIVAVLAVPSLALILTSAVPMAGLVQVVIFVLACWVCTYLGMRLMQHPKMVDMMKKKD